MTADTNKKTPAISDWGFKEGPEKPPTGEAMGNCLRHYRK
jgi:hypothetical protein